MGLWDKSSQFEEAVSSWSGQYAAPGPWARQRPDGIVVYQGTFVDRFLGRAHPLTPGLWFGPFVVWGLVDGISRLGVARTLAIFAGGVLLWTLYEYLLHRFVFHRVASDLQAKRSSFLMHGYHHEFPRDGSRLVAPPVMSWPLGTLIGIAYYLLLGPDHWLALYAGTAAGYVAYDWIHYYLHHGTPRTRAGRFLRRYHLAHHGQAHHAHFGISSPLWDLVFRTYSTGSSGATGRRAPAPQE
jgi:sterol desaturase/sphingolipid hydroxylase (fatty acid hydroxylase superfamily)